MMQMKCFVGHAREGVDPLKALEKEVNDWLTKKGPECRVIHILQSGEHDRIFLTIFHTK